MKAADIGKVFGTAFVSQILTFLNAAYQPFEGTIFVFDAWQPKASQSAVAIGFVVILITAAIVIRSNRPVSKGAIFVAGFVSLVLLVLCAATHVLLASGFAPSRSFLFWVRDIFWMLLYIFMLVGVGTTVALACLSLFWKPSGPG
ncbi:hypothetical protein [Bradyrhizobium cosmicum]|uniref:hypothetical protein n=1 Tax=Bradyrhizobium cosmicum TaxID=1404864 RepID=UPI0011637A8C|nr:hypothetical protein [Bradyrhizobium cosmicum]QDP25033.1 hypothetical protein FNV92_23990 [Bradyrhizobium cosmicum]